MTLQSKLGTLAALHERQVDSAHRLVADEMVAVFKDALARFSLSRHTISIGAFGLLIDGDHLHNHLVARTDSALSEVLWTIDTAVAASVIPNRYFKGRVLSEGQRGKV